MHVDVTDLQENWQFEIAQILNIFMWSACQRFFWTMLREGFEESGVKKKIIPSFSGPDKTWNALLLSLRQKILLLQIILPEVRNTEPALSSLEKLTRCPTTKIRWRSLNPDEVSTKFSSLFHVKRSMGVVFASHFGQFLTFFSAFSPSRPPPSCSRQAAVHVRKNVLSEGRG